MIHIDISLFTIFIYTLKIDTDAVYQLLIRKVIVEHSRFSLSIYANGLAKAFPTSHLLLIEWSISTCRVVTCADTTYNKVRLNPFIL